MKCTECGFTIWSKEGEKIGAHLECVSDDPPIDAEDLETMLARALSEDAA